jgi:HPr kinase/phosphorylase
MTITILDITQAAIDDANFQWLAGQQSTYPILPADATDPADLIGHLNLIHRRRIHVFGPEEIAFVNRMDAIRRRNLAIDLLSAGPPGLVFANGLSPQPDLLALCVERNVPVLSTQLSSAKVIDRVRTYLARALARSTSIHGVLMDVLGMGIVITGESGLGKSELALELISRGHGLVADDVVELIQLGPHTLEGRCPQLLQNMLEVRGLGMLDIRTIFGEAALRRRIKLKLIVQLVRRSTMESEYERLPLEALNENILGVAIKKVVIPVAAGRNLAVLTEAAVRNTILQLRGIDTTREFIERQHKLIASDDDSGNL